MKTRIPPPILLLVTGALMWFVARGEFGFPFVIPGAWVIAAPLGAIGIMLGGLGMRQFKSAGTTVNPLEPAKASALVSTGIFARTRNPMYLGLLFILTGWAIWLGSPTNILVLVAFVFVITELQIKPEETALQNLFGRDFENYCRRVGRWF